MGLTIPKGFTKHVREHGLVEWICPHGIGHPAPRAYQETEHWKTHDYWGHGCDGCCNAQFGN